jgi:hypothetical protein
MYFETSGFTRWPACFDVRLVMRQQLHDVVARRQGLAANVNPVRYALPFGADCGG